MAGPSVPTTISEPRTAIEFADNGMVSRIALDKEFVTGLLTPFGGRAQRVICGLLNGYSRRMAAISAGISDVTVKRMCSTDPKFAEACELAESAGFGRVFESELYDRALDREDRGSMRALELVVKARSADYREKAQLQMSVIHQAAGVREAGGAWKDVTPIDAPSVNDGK